MAFNRSQWQIQLIGYLLMGQVLVEGESHDVTRRISEMIQFVGQDDLINDLIWVRFGSNR